MSIQWPLAHRTLRRSWLVTGCLVGAAASISTLDAASTLAMETLAHSEQGWVHTTDQVSPQVIGAGFAVEPFVGDPADAPPELCPGCGAESATGPFGTDVSYLADPRDGIVTRFGSSDTSFDPFVVGLVRPSAVALPISGPFAGTMLIRDVARIWVIRPLRVADLDGDGDVDAADLVSLLAAWGGCPDSSEPCAADLDGDHTVDATDLAALLSDWG